ncbi:MAG: dihydrofolate reductase family protein [Chloroflexota bacterium]
MTIRVSVFIATSLDGYIAHSDGGIDWLESVPPVGNGDDAGYSAIYNAVDALVMGRGTFDKILTFDSYPYAGKPLVVLSSTLTTVPDKLSEHDISIMHGTPQRVYEQLSERGYTHIYLDGGKVIQSFLRAGLVDDMTITQIPILLGSGLSLFGELERDIHLRLLRSTAWHNGFVQSVYQVQREG